jgi:hypothetical protein
MSRFFRIFEEKYTVIDYASNYASFDHIKHGVYLWYFPIHLKPKKRDIHSAFDLFYNTDHLHYNLVNGILLDDNARNLRSITIGSKIKNPKSEKNLKPYTVNHDEFRVSEIIGDLFKGLSVLNRPVYIGKSSPKNPESSRIISHRIREHLKGRSDFGATIEELNDEIELKNFIVKVIDIGKIDVDFFNGEYQSSQEDLSNFIEIHLINILKPSFNLEYK